MLKDEDLMTLKRLDSSGENSSLLSVCIIIRYQHGLCAALSFAPSRLAVITVKSIHNNDSFFVFNPI